MFSVFSRSMNRAFYMTVLGLLLSMPGTAAEIFGPSQITASTSIPDSGLGFPIAQICDGVIDPPVWFNGFAAVPGLTGTIRLDFTTPQHLYDFVLWNDINVLSEGIRDFRLEFFDAADNLLDSTPVFVGPLGLMAPEIYTFDVVLNVKRVDLIVLSLNPSQRLEIREVGFNEPGTVASEAASWSELKALFG